MHTARRLRTGLLVSLALIAALAIAPAVYAGDGGPSAVAETPQTQPADTPSSEQADASSSERAAASSEDPVAGKAEETTAPAPTVSEGSQQTAGDADGAAPASAVTGAVATATGSSSADEAQPADSGADQGGSVTQAADATASAGQQDVGNNQATISVGEPGDGAPVSQLNQAGADATAAAAAETSTTTTGDRTPAPGTTTDAGAATPVASDQSADATATTGQTDVHNTAVNVRVGSPGDNSTVDQANVATAAASTSVTSPAGGQGTTAEHAAAVAAQDGAANTNVSVRVFSDGNDGAVHQTNTAAATASTTQGSGANTAATQNGVQNTNVSIRVGSDGTSGAVTQKSTAVAGPNGPATTSGIDTNLSISVGGGHLERPGTVWVWTWNWDRDESQTAEALLAAPASTWDWAWGDGAGQNGSQPGSVTSEPATGDVQTPGSLTWNWSWNRAGAPNWAWQWSRTSQLACGSCTWIWNWTWNWTGQPAQQGSTPGPARNSSPVDTARQANVVAADAQASVTASASQTVAQAHGGGVQYAGQLVSIDQTASAAARAAQSDVETVLTADELGARSNRITSTAAAVVTGAVVQHVDQTLLVDSEGDGTATQWSGQEADLLQSAHADANGMQQGISLRQVGTVSADSEAAAAADAVADQGAAQDAHVTGGTSDQRTAQLALVEQSSDVSAVVVQGGSSVPRHAGDTAHATGLTGALARIGQSLGQDAVRGGGQAAQTATQAAYVGQTGSAIATTTQQTRSTRGTAATSEAIASNRALVAQDGAQLSLGGSGLDIQDLAQQSIVLQTAVVVATSMGGAAVSTAVVANCAVVQQSAAQSFSGGSRSGGGGDLARFCAPPAAPTGGTAAASAPVTFAATAGSEVEPGTMIESPEDDVSLFHILLPYHPSVAAPRAGAATPPVAVVRTDPGTEPSAQAAVLDTQISVPRPTQARLDTRPGDHAGAGDAGKEPPLPPAGDPPSWVSALAAAVASGTGPAGIAAILAAFVLVPPLLLRAREGSAVRRPIDVLSRVDVPV